MAASDWLGRLLACLTCTTLACASNPAPRGWLAPPAKQQSDPFGAWIVVTAADGHSLLNGEFLALDRDSVFVLGIDGLVRSAPLAATRGAQLAFYDARTGMLALGTLLGSLTTASNGVGAVLTFPMWIIGGSIVTALQSRAPLRTVDHDSDWDALRMLARFPAGPPPDLPRRLPPKVTR